VSVRVGVDFVITWFFLFSLSEDWTTFGGFAGSAYGTLVQYVRVAKRTTEAQLG
jgi:hypothetical protein